MHMAGRRGHQIGHVQNEYTGSQYCERNTGPFYDLAILGKKRELTCLSVRFVVRHVLDSIFATCLA